MVSSSDRKLASAVGAKTARACDSCIRKRARWYCAADDAFLCQNCDDSVHNANPLARRHERVRLKGSNIKNPPDNNNFPNLESLARSWPDGFTRKARTPRGRKQAKPDPHQSFAKHPLYIVPELFSDENSQDDDNEQLLYRVPIFDPEMCTSGWPTENIPNVGTNIPASQNCHHGNIPSEIELAEFSADVESLLGKGLDEESFSMEELGLFSNFDKVKVETDEETPTANHNVDLKFEDCDDNTLETHKGGEFATMFQQSDDFESKNEKKKISLKIDYEGVITAWADERSPWINGERPDLDSNDCWPDFMDGWGTVHNPYGEMGAMSVGHACIMDDEGRKARVSRYKEKRQKRLFSKKIRYEVRKLNAEKRPRMKGRFVKRANFVAPLSFPLLTK